MTSGKHNIVGYLTEGVMRKKNKICHFTVSKLVSTKKMQGCLIFPSMKIDIEIN